MANFLTLDDRCAIQKGIEDGLHSSEIGKLLNRESSTIRKEIARNGGAENYVAVNAHENARKNANESHKIATERKIVAMKIKDNSMIELITHQNKVYKKLQLLELKIDMITKKIGA